MTAVLGRFPVHASGAAPLPMRDRWQPLESGTLPAIHEESEFARWLRRFEGSDPEIVAAMHEIDLDLLRWGLCLSPWQRLRATSLIEIKATAGRTRDKLVLPMPLALLRERERDPTEGDA